MKEDNMVETELSKYFNEKYINEMIKRFSNTNRRLSVEELALISLIKKYLKNIDDDRYYELCKIEIKKSNLEKKD